MSNTVRVFIDDPDAHKCFGFLCSAYARACPSDHSTCFELSVKEAKPSDNTYTDAHDQALYSVKFHAVSDTKSPKDRLKVISSRRLLWFLDVVAACLLVSRHWPYSHPDIHFDNSFILALAMLLWRTNLKPEQITKLLFCSAPKYIQSSRKEYLGKAGRLVRQRLVNNQPVSDIPVIRQALDQGNTDKVAEWILGKQDAPEAMKQLGARYLTPEQAVTQLNSLYAIVSFDHGTRIVEADGPHGPSRQLQIITERDLRLKFENVLVDLNPNGKRKPENAAKVWLKHPKRRQFNSINFDPNPYVPGPFEYHFLPDYLVPREYNLFTGFPREDPDDRITHPFWNVWREVCQGKEKLFNYVISWLAHVVQKPEQRNQVALVLRGFMGLEGPLVAHLNEAFGCYFASISTVFQAEHLSEIPLDRALVVHIGETVWMKPALGVKLFDEILLAPRTPLRYRREILGLVDNYKRLILSVRRGWSPPRGIPYHRFFIIDASPETSYRFAPPPDDDNDDRRPRALTYALRDLPIWPDVVEAPHATMGCDLQQALAASPLVRWWYEVLKTGYLDPDLKRESCPFRDEILKDQLFAHFSAWCERNAQDPGEPNGFKEHFGELTSARNKRPSIRAQSDLTTRPRYFVLPARDVCRATFADQNDLPLSLREAPEAVG